MINNDPDYEFKSDKAIISSL